MHDKWGVPDNVTNGRKKLWQVHLIRRGRRGDGSREVRTPAPTPDSHPGLLGGTCTHLRRGRSPAALGVPWALAEPPRGLGGFRKAGTEEPELDIFLENPGEGGRQPGLRRTTSWAQEAFI